MHFVGTHTLISMTVSSAVKANVVVVVITHDQTFLAGVFST